MNENVKNILKNLPRSPGVYQFFDGKWMILYVGKSVNLKSRVNSYFNWKAKLNFAKQKMVDLIADIKIIVTSNETESLILETNLIKEFEPKYNILMKDWKNHVYIKITDEFIPRIQKTRIRTKSWTYFGPFLSVFYINKTLKVLQKIFGYRNCNIVFKREENGDITLSNIWNTKIPCIYYYIGRCPAPCLKEEDKITKYENDIKEIKNFLNGHTTEIKQNLELDMREKAKELKFEEAQKIKECLESIASLEETQIVREWVLGDYNVVNYINKFDKFYIALMQIRDSKINWFYNYEIKNKLEESDEDILKTFVETNYIENSGHKVIYLVPFDLDFEGLDIKQENPKIWNKKELLEMAYRNIYEYAYKSHLDSLSTKWFSKKTMQSLLEILKYKQINKSIVFECNDISHISGSHTVASRSIIENWKTNPQKYRKFKIKTLENWKINDFDSMREIMTRRLYEIDKTKYIPDMIVIDWWKWQLSSVVKVIENFLNEVEIEDDTKKLIEEVQIVSIAKREEELFIIKEWDFHKIVLDKESNELRLVQKIRDEAHRFAISFNRDTRIKSAKKNILESLPWIWEKTRKKLLKRYWSVENLKNVPKEELKEILNKKQIEILEEHLII